MFHYLVTFKTSIQAYNSAPSFGQRRCDSRVQGLGALKLQKSMAHLIRFQSLYILSLVILIDIPRRARSDQIRLTYIPDNYLWQKIIVQLIIE